MKIYIAAFFVWKKYCFENLDADVRIILKRVAWLLLSGLEQVQVAGCCKGSKDTAGTVQCWGIS
jgi:hypothetical protein